MEEKKCEQRTAKLNHNGNSSNGMKLNRAYQCVKKHPSGEIDWNEKFACKKGGDALFDWFIYNQTKQCTRLWKG